MDKNSKIYIAGHRGLVGSKNNVLKVVKIYLKVCVGQDIH